jgi:anaerobic magnesium-protoporphyrin IX monomethyl ester cyclase
MKEIVFINPPSFYYSAHLPYSLLALASYINQFPGYKAKILEFKHDFPDYRDAQQNAFIDKVIECMTDVTPDYVGIPSFSPTYRFTLELSKILKERFNLKIIVGNIHATLYPESFIFEGSPIDYVVIGEGEKTLAELLKGIDEGNELLGILGIAYFDKIKGFIKTKPRDLIVNLDELPPTDYSLIDMDIYLSLNHKYIRYVPIRGVALYSGRGCPYHCIFCSANLVWDHNTGKAVRFRSPKRISEEIISLENKYNINGFYFQDDTFISRKKRVLEFCDAIKGYNLVWGCCGRVNEVDDELLSAMKSAGCIQIDFGVESGAPSLLKTINKGISREQIKRAFSLCRKHKIRSFANMMVNLPGETIEDISFSEQLIKEIKPTRVAVAVLTPLPGTVLYEKFLKEKVSEEEYHMLIKRDDKGERFKFSKHDVPAKENYDRIDNIVQPLVHDALKIFTNRKFIMSAWKRNLLRSLLSITARLSYDRFKFRMLKQTGKLLPESYKSGIKNVLSSRKLAVKHNKNQ